MNVNSMLLRYVEKDTGRTMDLVGWTIDPLGYDDLVAVAPNQSVTMPVQLRDVEVLDEHGAAVHLGQLASSSFILQSPFSSNVIALVDGGWLPSMWAAHNKIILVDRNVVSELQARFVDGEKRNGTSNDFVDLLAEWPVRINPLLYAMEGNQRRLPSPDEVEAQIIEAVQKIQKALPNAIIEPDGLSGLQGVIGLIQDSAAGMQRRSQFLMSVAPRLMAPQPKDRRIDTWLWILAEAGRIGVPRRSLPVLTVLSSLVCPQGSNPAKKVLKPCADYDEKQAYNALCDLRALELFIATLALFPKQPATLCTQDRHLALLWVAMDVHNMRWGEREPTFDVSFEKLFPNWTEDERFSLLDGA